MALDQTLVLPILLLSAVSLVPSVWLTWVTLRNVLTVVNPPTVVSPPIEHESSVLSASDRSRSRRRSSISPRSPRQKNKSVPWNSYCAVLCSLCYTFSLALLFVRETILYERVRKDTDDEQRTLQILYHSPMMSSIYTVYFLSYSISNTLLGLVCMERLIGTLKNSQYRISNRAITIGRGWIGMQALLSVSAVPFAFMGDQHTVLLVLSPVFVTYPLFFLWIMYRFMSTTRIIADKINDGDSIGESMRRWTELLLNASLRLSVLSGLATMSSVVNIGFVVAAGIFRSPLRIHILGQILDCVINIYCNCCVFSRSKHYYFWLLGWLHAWLLQKLTLH